MSEPVTEPRPTPVVESDLTPETETIATRLEKLPFAALRAVLAEAERLAGHTWHEGPAGFENIRGGKIRVYESSQSHKFKLVVEDGTTFPNLMSSLVALRGTEFESVAAAKEAIREILDEDRARIIE